MCVVEEQRDDEEDDADEAESLLKLAGGDYDRAVELLLTD